jgi:deoxycytidylate deaminase
VKAVDREMLLLAYQYAMDFSPDPSTQNGAVLYDPDNGIPVSLGANHFADGVENTHDRWHSGEKYELVVHAETNAIYAAASRGIKTAGLVLYCPWAACLGCANAIIQSGIREVVTHELEGYTPHGRWPESLAKAAQVFREAGVFVRKLRGRVDPTGTIVIRRDRQLYRP